MRWLWMTLAAALVAAVLFLPLASVVGRLAPGLRADAVTGSIWKGRMRGADYAGVALGDIDVGLDPRALFSGKLRLDFERMGPQLVGQIGGNRSLRSVEGLQGAVVLPLLPSPLPAVELRFDAVSARFDASAGCLEAGGTVVALIPALPGVADNVRVEGVPVCDGDALLVPLRAPFAGLGIDLRLWVDGRYRADARVLTENRMLALALRGLGFRPAEGGLSWSVAGNSL